MKVGEHRVQRIHGTLTLELEGGGAGQVEIDLDVGGDYTTYGVDYDWADSFFQHGLTRPVQPNGTTYSLRIDRPNQERPHFTVTLPTT